MKLKTTLFAAVAALTLATTATAESFFSYQNKLDRATTLRLGQVVSEGAGTVSVYSFHRRKQGALLGSVRVNSGANYNVRVNIRQRPTTELIAVLTVNGQTVATRHYDIEDRD